MKTKSLLTILVMIMLSGAIFGQGFKPPQEGKAVIYFVRVSSYGFAVSFEYFHQDRYIGAFKGENYLRYECDPGAQLLWASSENKEFLTSELKPGGSYIVVVDVIMGFWKAHVGLSPISVKDAELFQRAKKLITSKPPVEIKEAQIEKMNKKLSDFIPEMLDKYEKEWKQEHNFKHIDADMAIPEEDLN
jgi:hypothetical protein